MFLFQYSVLFFGFSQAGRSDDRRPTEADNEVQSGFLAPFAAFSYCGQLNKNEQYHILKDFLIESEGKKTFYSSYAEGGNKIPQEALDKITDLDENTFLTYGNGWCDKNVYRAWNKCAVSGICYEDCTDGLCHEQVKKNAKQLLVPRGCNDVYLQCARECSEDSRCKAFSFKNQNVLGNGQYECLHMDAVMCARSEFDHGDPRSVYHAKGSAVQELFEEYGVTTLDGLDREKFQKEDEHLLNVWSSWQWHQCWSTEAGKKCGIGFQKRLRKVLQKGVEVVDMDKRDCEFTQPDGTLIECQDVEEEDEAGDAVETGHGWMAWGEWTPCSESCGQNAIRKRTRRCGTCVNPKKRGLCQEPTEPLHSFTNEHTHCPMTKQSETEQCSHQSSQCLPRSNGKGGKDKYLVLRGWATHQKGTPANDESDYEGGCVNYSLNSEGKKVKINGPRQAFVECMRLCADAGEDCLSVTYFPRLQKPYWQTFWRNNEFNCYLHTRRCHEDADFRDKDHLLTQPSLETAHKNKKDYQASAPSWYAFKDLCSNTMICDRQGPKADPYYSAICNSSGNNAFPALPACSCPWSRDRHSEVRAWGNPFGWHFYNVQSKRIEMQRDHKGLVTQRPKWYSQRNANRDVNPLTTFTILPCHDPCLHNKCSKLSKCVFNADSPVGYDCVCTWPATNNPDYDGHPSLAGLDGNNGCKPFDFRNSQMTDNEILFGGGWNSLKKPGEVKPVKPSPTYYHLQATDDPWTFEVDEAMKIPPASATTKKGRFYNCIVNLDYKKQMFVGGKWGQFFDIMDDKTMVYEWDNSVYNGKWVGLDGQDLTDVPCGGDKDGAGTVHGCTREGEWPDLPHTPVSACQGQCRDGQVGYGPTNVHWVNQYCSVNSTFWNKSTNDWEPRSFDMCDYKLEEDSEGEEVLGRSGKWRSVPNPNKNEQKAAWKQALLDTIPFYGNQFMETLDADDHIDLNKYTTVFNGTRYVNYWRYKSGKYIPGDKYNVFHGTFNEQQSLTDLFILDSLRTYNAYGQPLCGVIGDRVMTGSGRIARIMSLPKDEDQVKKERVWKIEEGSRFPEPRRKTDGTHCLTNQKFDQDGNVVMRSTMDNRRQNFGTVVTTEGMWMLGGLVESASDLPTRSISKVFNIPGCTKTGHLEDVWVFNPKGWSREKILGEAAAKYSHMTDAEILPTIDGYEDNSMSRKELANKEQSFAQFRLYETATDGPTIQQALDEGWECTGIDGNWCRKPFLNRNTKGAESQVMCFEWQAGTEDRAYSAPGKSGTIPKRPRICSNDETANDDNDCVCYIIQAAGQSGPKQTPDGAGFRPEIDYLEVRRADGTWGSDRALYQDTVEEYCPDANATYPNVDPAIIHDDESAVADGTQCTSECGEGFEHACNRRWKKKNLRKRWHESGRIRFGRMGSLSGVLKGELMLWGGECYGGTTVQDFGPDGKERSQRANRPRPCRMQMLKNGQRQSGDYIEAYSFIRMNKAGFLFGEPRVIDLVGFHTGQVSNDESAVSQAYSAMNFFHSQN